MSAPNPESGSIPPPRSQGVPGKWVIAGMFAFGIAATLSLWVYWYFHSGPFHPLQKAIAAEFPKSIPRVDGGQRRMHKGGPRLIWVILRVPFKPEEEEGRSQEVVDRVVELTREHLTMSDWDQLNLRLFYGEPERVIHSKDFQLPLNAPVEPAKVETPATESATKSDE